YVKCLVAATPAELMIDPDRGKEMRGLSEEDVARMEHEMASQGREFKIIEETYGKNVLKLVLVVTFLRKLLENARVSRYLSQHHPELLAEFQKLVEARNLMDGAPSRPQAE